MQLESLDDTTGMPTTITTVTVAPNTADGLREVRDEQNLSSLNSALELLLTEHCEDHQTE